MRLPRCRIAPPCEGSREWALRLTLHTRCSSRSARRPLAAALCVASWHVPRLPGWRAPSQHPPSTRRSAPQSRDKSHRPWPQAGRAGSQARRVEGSRRRRGGPSRSAPRSSLDTPAGGRAGGRRRKRRRASGRGGPGRGARSIAEGGAQEPMHPHPRAGELAR